MDSLHSSAKDSKPVFYELLLKNRLDELVILSDWINDLTQKFGASDQGSFRLELIVAEAVTNIIENAYQDAGEHQIKVTLEYWNNTARVQVKDDGSPFDPLEKPEFVFPSSLEDAKVGGLGIHLIRHYSDECFYHREGDKNILMMVIYNLK